MTNDKAAIKFLVQDLDLYYGKFQALKKINLDIKEKEITALIGPSGCGKSTFGRTILQVYPQPDGRTMYYGRTIDELCPEYIRETIKTLDFAHSAECCNCKSLCLASLEEC